MELVLKKAIELYNELNSKYQYWKFTDDYKKAEIFPSIEKRIDKIVLQEKIYGDEVLIFEELALFHIEYLLFLSQKDSLEEKDIIHFQYTNSYTEIFINSIVGIDDCSEHVPSIWMKTAGLFLANIMINGNLKEIEYFIKLYIGSLEGKNSIFGYGHPKHHKAWFLIDLGLKYFDLTYNDNYAYLPEEYNEYISLLDNWNTIDISWVQQQIDLFCEKNLLLSYASLENYVQQEEDGEVFELVDVKTFLYPYEILAWLKLRELKGLKNPKEFSHPLMNTPIAKMFLELKTPLEKPKELPYAKELITKLQEHCKSITELENEISLHQKDYLALKSTNYKAVLPKGHPQEKKLEDSPFSYSFYEKGTPFSYENLGEFDINLIKWIEKEE